MSAALAGVKRPSRQCGWDTRSRGCPSGMRHHSTPWTLPVFYSSGLFKQNGL